MGNILLYCRPATHMCATVSVLTISHVWTGKLHVLYFYLKQTQRRDTVLYTSSSKLFSRLPPLSAEKITASINRKLVLFSLTSAAPPQYSAGRRFSIGMRWWIKWLSSYFSLLVSVLAQIWKSLDMTSVKYAFKMTIYWP